jgi:hypothetical protein
MEEHSHHKPGSSGNECVACHMPQIEQTMADVMVRSHTFKFISPTSTETLKVPNPCTGCHTEKTIPCATNELQTWKGLLPRVAD